VPQLGLLKIAPQNVPQGSNFNVTFVVFNYGDVDCTNPSAQLVQPAGATFINANFTNLFGGGFSGAVGEGLPLEAYWSHIPAHSAVAVTYNFQATGAVGSQITLDAENDDFLSGFGADYLGAVDNQPTTTLITAAGTPVLPVQTSMSNGVLHHFTVASSDIFIIQFNNGAVVVEGPDTVVTAGSGAVVSQLNGTIVVSGEPTFIPVGSTTARFLLENLAKPVTLATVSSAPPQILVNQGSVYPAPPKTALIAASAGAGLINQDGNGLINQDGNGLINQDGNGIINQDGNGLIAQDGNGVISNDGGSLVSNSSGTIVPFGGNLNARILSIASTKAGSTPLQVPQIIAVNGGAIILPSGAILSSTPGSTGTIKSSTGAIISAGGVGLHPSN
jgi:hypothetical protein